MKKVLNLTSVLVLGTTLQLAVAQETHEAPDQSPASPSEANAVPKLSFDYCNKLNISIREMKFSYASKEGILGLYKDSGENQILSVSIKNTSDLFAGSPGLPFAKVSLDYRLDKDKYFSFRGWDHTWTPDFFSTSEEGFFSEKGTAKNRDAAKIYLSAVARALKRISFQDPKQREMADCAALLLQRELETKN